MYNPTDSSSSIFFSKRKIVNSVFGVVGVLVALGVSVAVVKNPQVLRILAGPEKDPKNVTITNLTENSVSVSWTTDAPTLGSISYGILPSNFDQIGLDDTDAAAKSTVHHITLKPLKPSTTYYFEIVSGGKKFDNKGSIYQISTPQTLDQVPPPPKTIFGSLKDAVGMPFGSRAVVYFDIPGVYKGSAVANSTGNYSFSISTLRSTNLSSYASYSQGSSVSIKAIGEGGLSGAVSTAISNTSPAPTLTLTTK